MLSVRRPLARVLALAVVLPVAVTACSDAGQRAAGGGSGSSPAAPTGSIRVQVSGEPEETRAYVATAQAYERSHPGTKVEVVAVTRRDHLPRLSTAFASGSAPDVFLLNYRDYPQFVQRGALEAVGPLLEQRGVKLDAYYPEPLRAFTFDGGLQCMPQNVSSLVVYYNRRVFAAAGVQPPQAGWTFDDMARTARALTKGGVRGLGVEPTIVRMAPFVWSNGGDVVDDQERPTQLTMSSPAAAQTVRRFVDLVRAGVVPSEAEVKAQDLETRFVTGKLGMMLESRRFVPQLREVSGLDWDVAPLPGITKPVSILHSDGYCIARRSKNAALAADFVAFATGEQGQRIAALTGRTVPSLRTVAGSPAFLDPSKPPRSAKVFLDAVPVLRNTPVVATWSEIEDLAEEMLTRAFYDEGADVDAVLRELDEKSGPVLARSR